MEEFRQVLICALSVSAVAAVIRLLPSSTFEKYGKFLSGLILMVILIKPMIQLTGTLTSTFSETFSLGDSVRDGQEIDLSDAASYEFFHTFTSQAEKTIQSCIVNTFSDVSVLSVEVELDDSDTTSVRISSIAVQMGEKTDSDSICRYIQDTFGCENVSVSW